MNYLYSFIIGGLICIPAQILLDKTKLTNAKILTIYVVTGVILSAVNLYKPIVDFASSGATITLSGFGNTLMEGVKDNIATDGLLGVLNGGLTASAAGIATAIIIALLCSIIFKSKQK